MEKITKHKQQPFFHTNFESSHRDLLAKYLFERGYLPGKCLCVRGIGVSWKIVGVRGLDRASWKMSICSMRK